MNAYEIENEFLKENKDYIVDGKAILESLITELEESGADEGAVELEKSFYFNNKQKNVRFKIETNYVDDILVIKVLNIYFY